MSEYPEHDKMRKVQERSEIIGEFLEWLNQSDYTICTFNERQDRYVSTYTSINALLAACFGIDLAKIDKEKRTMLERLRNG